MNLLDLVPPEYKIGVVLVAVLAFGGATARGGYKVGHMQAGAEFAATEKGYQKKIDDLNATVATLKENISTQATAIETQNKSVQEMALRTELARQAQAAAQRIADQQKAQTDKQLKKLESIVQQAKTCGDVLAGYWRVST